MSSSSGLCVLMPSRTRLGLDGGEIGGGQILLAQMDVVGAQLERLAPVVVDDQLAAVAPAQLEAVGDFLANALGRGILEAQLDGADAEGNQPLEPGEVRDDRIEQVEPAGSAPWRHDLSRSKNGVPATGVDGAAMSRISIRPAS